MTEIAMLCKQFTTLTEADIQIIEGMSAVLQPLAASVTILTNGETPDSNAIVNAGFAVCTKKITSVLGSDKLTGIAFADGSERPLDGLFLANGKAGALDFAAHLGILQKDGAIRVDASGIKNIEDKVRKGEWTWDYFLDCAKACTKDTDADGTPNTWGIATGYAAYGEEVVAGGGNIVTMKDGKLICELNTPAAIEGLTFMSKQANSGAIMKGADGNANIGYGEGHTAFAAGEVAFLYTELRIIANKAYSDEFGMRRMEATWGVLPLPVKAGEPYRNIIGNHDTDWVLMTNKDREFSVKVYTAFARRQNDVNWKDCVAEAYLQDPTDTNKADILANYVIPNVTPNYQWVSGDVNDLYRSEAVYPIYDEKASPAAIAEAVAPKIQGLLDNISEFPKN